MAALVAGFPAGTVLTVTLDQRFPGKEHNIGKFRLSVATAPAPGNSLSGPPEAIARILSVEPAKRAPEAGT